MSLPYQPYIFFVNEAGQVPQQGMWYDDEGGVTVLVVLVADAGFEIVDDVHWAVITDYEFQSKVSSVLSFAEFADNIVQADQRDEVLAALSGNNITLCDVRWSDDDAGFSNRGMHRFWCDAT